MGKPITAGPFGSVVDPSDPGAARPTRLFDAVNMYVPNPVLGSPALARHGFQGQHTPLGLNDLARTGQGMHEHRRADGTIDRYVFAGGRMYEWDGAAGVTDITPAGILIDATNPVFAATFNEKIVVSDETNKPWLFDPVLGTAVTIEYNTAAEEWATKGGPVVYSGRVFFIIRSAGSSTLITEDGDTITTEDDVPLLTEALLGVQNTVAWSAALDATQGYDQNNFDNLWTLTQSSSNPLTGLFADEAALTYLRTQGIGYITGKVEEDFRASATTDAIDTTIGTDAPAALVVVNRRAWFLDLDGRVHRMAATAKPEDLWAPMRRVVTAHVGTAQNADNVRRYGRAAYHPGLKLVLFTIWDAQTLYVFDAVSGGYLGTWQVGGGIRITAMGALADSASRNTFLLLGSRATVDTTALHGVLWKQKFPDDPSPWHDQADASVPVHTKFPREIETHWLAHNASLVFRALVTTASLVGDAVRHLVGLRYTVPASGQSPLRTACSSAVVGVKSPTDSIASAAWGLGKEAQGGAIRLRISAEHQDDHQFGVNDLSVEVQTVKARRNAI